MKISSSKPENNPDYLTTRQAAELMGISEATVRKYCSNGELPDAKQDRENGPWKIPNQSVITWIQDHLSFHQISQPEIEPPTAWQRFRNHPFVFYPVVVFVVISAILGLFATAVSITVGWEDTMRFAYASGLLRAFPPAKEGEILIVISEFDYSEGVTHTKAHNEIQRTIQSASTTIDSPNIRIMIQPQILEADDKEGARKLGNRYNANMVIGGEDTGVHVIVNFLNIKNPDYYASDVRISEKESTQLLNPSEYAHFITEDLPSEISFLSFFAIGQSFFWEHKYLDAIISFDKALESLPSKNSLIEWLHIIYNLRASAYEKLGKLENAIDDYNKAITLNPDNALAINNRGVAYQAQGDFKNAYNDYTKVIVLHPENAIPYNNRGVWYSEQGDLEKAIADYDKAIMLDPEFATAYRSRGVTYYEQGDLDKAIADYNKAITLNPEDALAYKNRGVAYLDQEHFESAIADYSRAIVLDPEFAAAYNFRGIAYHALGEIENAIDDYRRTLELDPESQNRDLLEDIISEFENQLSNP